jgi:hypothetical protein
MTNPHSWWVVQKFHGPPSLKCPNPEKCDGRRCKAGNDLSRFINAQKLSPANYKQSPGRLVEIIHPQSGKAHNTAGGGIQNGTNIQMWQRNGTAAQKWVLESDGRIINPQSGKALGAAGGGTQNGTNIQLWQRNGTAAQKWVLESDGSIINPQSGKALDVHGGNTYINGANIQLWQRNRSEYQKWRIV